MSNRAEILKQQLSNSIGLPLADLLPATAIETVLEQHQVKYRERVFTPMVTVWVMLTQVLAADKSLRQAVSRVVAWLTAQGQTPPSSDTGAYSKARQRLPETVLQDLWAQSARQIEAQVQPEQLWCGLWVRVCDGTSMLMSDTPDNQQSYPQTGNQAPGCGFPIAKVVVCFSLFTGALLNAVMAPFHTSELVLARQFYQQLRPNEVMLADSAFGTYGDLALIMAAGAQAVFRKHHQRKTDFRRGKRLGIGDHIVTWDKPQRCPAGLDAATFATFAEHLQVREVHLLIQTPGFRPKQMVVVTTLLDARRYPKAQLANLYRLRWQAAEINLRHVKTTLKMELLTAKTPAMVGKEFWTHLLAYNLLRQLMWQTATIHAIDVGRISLQGTRQLFNELIPILALVSHKKQRSRLYAQLLVSVAQSPLPLRPNRVEPRVKKRRPKAYPRMQEPRETLRRKMVA